MVYCRRGVAGGLVSPRSLGTPSDDKLGGAGSIPACGFILALVV